MNKVILQLLVLVGLFFTTWFLLDRIDYVHRLHLDKLNEKTERKIGDLIARNIQGQRTTIQNDSLDDLLNKVKVRLCADSNEAAGIRIFLVESKNINAFSLPGSIIIVNTSLIGLCDSSSELAGVLAHELAHIRLHHVTKKLSREFGITILLSTATNGNSEILRQIVGKLSSTAFERQMERDADDSAIVYLKRAGISQAGLPDFLDRLDKNVSNTSSTPEWISTHPDTDKRVKDLRQQISANPATGKQPLTNAEWDFLKDNCTDN
jgi:predicted Zn-dependent protease